MKTYSLCALESNATPAVSALISVDNSDDASCALLRWTASHTAHAFAYTLRR